ncbi:MAG: hypothetical protein LBC18_00970 [Opitutaceae bacterium]|nr:hypothetical protein [Opitutaceae bacterium]
MAFADAGAPFVIAGVAPTAAAVVALPAADTAVDTAAGAAGGTAAEAGAPSVCAETTPMPPPAAAPQNATASAGQRSHVCKCESIKPPDIARARRPTQAGAITKPEIGRHAISQLNFKHGPGITP